MKSTKKSLLLSTLSLMLCVAMLLGTTFAWFTDSVTSGKNIITAGNLDVELVSAKKGTVGTTTALFADVSKWEPGVAVYDTLTVKNVGNLALKYQLNMIFDNEIKVGGHGLSEVLKVGTFEGTVATGATREAVLAQVSSWQALATFSKSGNLAANTDDTAVTYVIYWQPGDNDNLYNMNNGNQGETLSIDFGVKLFATQYTVESDSFGIDYDENAVWPEEVGSAAELEEALAGDKPIQLTQDMDITDINFTKDTEMNLGGNTITSNNANTIANGKDLTMKNGELKFTDEHSFTYIDVRPDDSTNGVYTFEGMKFTSEKKDPTYGPSTDRIEKLVALTAEKNNVAKFIFKDCVFNNAKVLFSGMGEGGSFNATFENCTFTGLGSSEFIDASNNYVSGTITIKNCTFTMEATSSSAAAIDANSHVTVKFEGANTVNITAATAVPSADLKEVIKVNGSVTSAKVVSGAATVNGKDTVTVSGIATK